ncbi:arginine N-succinyltransferase [Marinobacter pelagius]|uniref:arginine N-succinyltransferase n=1 Tax=Marinobacter sp. C7 TaxID=2951363 RepID=UPI001EEFF3CA|nr:arginine N-succinyltransferase [Marinobacter sp. C7]MCG7198896.1 arginine N-succinyltransferase [Marinobacter sp. C7]
MIIRPVAPTDLDALYQIADESGPGFTSLMPDRDALARKIDHAGASFRRNIHTPGDEHYLFVLEDDDTGAIMGTTGIEAFTGHTRPLHHFHHNTVVHHSRDLGLRRQVETLTRCSHYNGRTEICSLYLRPEYRRANAGKLLSRVRFLFMAQHPERFTDTVIAEMRGISDHAGQSPFWNWLRHHFVDLEFTSATSLVGSGYTDFIEELMPAAPLYTHLMSDEARSVIGNVHPQTRPALRMLENEGFRHRGFVDLFDAGPTVECELRDIVSVQHSAHYAARFTAAGAGGHPRVTTEPVIVATSGTMDFRATVTEQALIDPEAGTVTLPSSIGDRLGIGKQASVWLLPLNQVRAGARKQKALSAVIPADEHGERHYAH